MYKEMDMYIDIQPHRNRTLFSGDDDAITMCERLQ